MQAFFSGTVQQQHARAAEPGELQVSKPELGEPLGRYEVLAEIGHLRKMSAKVLVQRVVANFGKTRNGARLGDDGRQRVQSQLRLFDVRAIAIGESVSIDLRI